MSWRTCASKPSVCFALYLSVGIRWHQENSLTKRSKRFNAENLFHPTHRSNEMRFVHFTGWNTIRFVVRIETTYKEDTNIKTDLLHAQTCDLPTNKVYFDLIELNRRLRRNHSIGHYVIKISHMRSAASLGSCYAISLSDGERTASSNGA